MEWSRGINFYGSGRKVWGWDCGLFKRCVFEAGVYENGDIEEIRSARLGWKILVFRNCTSKVASGNSSSLFVNIYGLAIYC